MRLDARSGVRVMALVIALTLAGCGGASSPGALAGHTSGQTTTQASATPAPIPTLPWRKISLPVGLNPHTVGFAFSPVNGRIAWACAPQSSGGSYRIWRTQDAAATWQPVGIITPNTPLPPSNCYLTADQNDINSIDAMFPWGVENIPANSGPSGDTAYISSDGGSTWTPLPGGFVVDHMATIAGVTYATLIDTAHNDHQDFVVSANHLVSWHSILPPTQTPPPDSIFWAAPSGELLWAAMNSGVLYHSSNGGASWATVPAPAGQSVEVTVAQWSAGSWLFCGSQMVATAQTHDQNECSADLGKTWIARADLTDTWECGHCGQNGDPSSGVTPCASTMLLGDGSLLAVCGNDPQDSGQPASYALSRLPSGATRWATIGSTPCQTANLAQTGQLWCVNSVRGVDTIYILDQLP